MITEVRGVLEELEFMDSPLQDKESYFYIQENYDRIVEELGDNLASVRSQLRVRRGLGDLWWTKLSDTPHRP